MCMGVVPFAELVRASESLTLVMRPNSRFAL